jgi:hypothetical protein
MLYVGDMTSKAQCVVVRLYIGTDDGSDPDYPLPEVRTPGPDYSYPYMSCQFPFLCNNRLSITDPSAV